MPCYLPTAILAHAAWRSHSMIFFVLAACPLHVSIPVPSVCLDWGWCDIHAEGLPLFAHGAILAVALWQRLYAVGSCRPRNRMMPLSPVGQWLIYHKMWGGGVLGACPFFCVQALPEAIYGMIIP